MTGCTPCYCQITPAEPKEIESDRVQGQFARWAMQNYGLEVIASGGGMMDQIKVLTLWFSSSQRMYVPEARHLLVALVREFVRQINEDEGIRPYLESYPVTEENVEISVTFLDHRYKRICSPFVGLVDWGYRKFIDYAQKPYPSAPLCDMHKETWQEAVQLVEQGKLGEE